MSQQLISRSADLRRLRDEGFDVRIVSNHLVVGDVPYVNQQKEVKFGTLVSELTLAADVTTTPSDHVIHFSGDLPCDKAGAALTKIILNSDAKNLALGFATQHSFSSKPAGGYKDYYHKVTSYIAMLATPAQSLDSEIKATNFRPIVADESESVFQYLDTASSRSEIGIVSAKLELPSIAIVGLGGTGAYVLDLLSKAPIKKIHLFDGDKFLQHNAFRFPGAASLDDLKKQSTKVEYLAEKYTNIHRHVIPHPVNIDESNVDQLRNMAFVFICLDKSKVKRLIFKTLDDAELPYVDTGMGIQLVEDSLLGLVRTTTSTNEKRDHIGNRVSLSDGDQINEYSLNIQIADLNALNATLAVIKWKKLMGFYHDLEKEHNSVYTISGNHLSNEDQA